MNASKIITILLCLAFAGLKAQPKLELTPFASGLSDPLGIAHAGDSRLFIVQRRGLIRITEANGSLKATPFLDLSAKVSPSGNERGLLGLAFHPNYHNNGFFYVNYTRESDGATIISRFSVNPSDPDLADATSEQVLMTVPQPQTNHNGGCILFGPDGKLYIGMGDGGGSGDPQNYAQNPLSLLGKMLRMDVDGASSFDIPSDNPFFGMSSIRNEIWALGLRNPWRFSFDRLTGDLWIADVGQDAREEINFQSIASAGGENYGWRCYEGNSTYNTAGCQAASNYVFPVFDYPHPLGTCTGSVTGGYVYRGALQNGLYGKYLAADYCRGNIYWVEQTATGFDSGTFGTFSAFQYSSFGEDMHGELYVTLLGSGTVRKVTDTSDCRPVALILADDTMRINTGETALLSALFHPSLEYQWQLNGNDLPGAASEDMIADIAGDYTVKVTNPANSCSNTSISVKLIIGTTSVNEAADENHFFKIYPNPASGSFMVKSNAVSHPIEEVALLNFLGETIMTINANSALQIAVETDGLPKGMYLARLKSSGSYYLRKVAVN